MPERRISPLKSAARTHARRRPFAPPGTARAFPHGQCDLWDHSPRRRTDADGRRACGRAAAFPGAKTRRRSAALAPIRRAASPGRVPAPLHKADPAPSVTGGELADTVNIVNFARRHRQRARASLVPEKGGSAGRRGDGVPAAGGAMR
ncbi:MAG TPA: hypothetical protein VEZ20_09225 [Allosphingosinicella sp.]|nr:hypothetical protein [Allosphingosinicella sp.]